MNKEQMLSILCVDDILDLPQRIDCIINGNEEERNEIYKELIKANNGNMSYDWFQSIYEEELSQRKQSKQDFTPANVGRICSLLVGEYSSLHEPTAGNGSMIIQSWWNKVSSIMPWEWEVTNFKIDCWELSDRAIPILLLNLSIRGIIGIVHHGDVLTQEAKATYILSNTDALSFSKIIKL